jgi:hypothetical protein
MIKIGFPLEVEDNWPPYEVEHIHVDVVEGGYLVKSIPFFVRGISYEDILYVDLYEQNYVVDWRHIKKSKNTTLWIMEKDSSAIIDEIEALGCGVEGGALPKLYSINVPGFVKFDQIDGLMSKYQESGIIEVAYPSFRH